MSIRWLTASFDTAGELGCARLLAADHHHHASVRRGSAYDFTTLLPENGDSWLPVQAHLGNRTECDPNGATVIQTIQEKKFGMVNAGFVMPLFTGGKINAANKAAKIKFEESEIETIQKSYELTGELVERYFGLILANQAMKVR